MRKSYYAPGNLSVPEVIYDAVKIDEILIFCSFRNGKMSSNARDSSKVVVDSSNETFEHFDYMLKVLVIGNSGVGKTSMLLRYTEKTFQEAYVSTVGIDFKVKTLHRNGKKIKLQVWDTAGQERYRTITTAYYRGAMGFLLVFDVTCEESFKAITDW